MSTPATSLLFTLSVNLAGQVSVSPKQTIHPFRMSQHSRSSILLTLNLPLQCEPCLEGPAPTEWQTAAAHPQRSGSENQECRHPCAVAWVNLLSFLQKVTSAKRVRMSIHISLGDSQASHLTKLLQVFMRQKWNLIENKNKGVSKLLLSLKKIMIGTGPKL